MTTWHVYILQCADSTFYTGATTDVARRVHEHNHTPQAAAYTRTRRPVRVVHTEKLPTRAAAYRREAEIKSLTHGEKRRLIGQ